MTLVEQALISSFSSWMVAGFGAVFGLLVANIETVGKFVAPKLIGCSIMLFLCAVILNVVQRYLASIIAAKVAVGKELESIQIPNTLDIKFVLQQIENVTFWPERILVRWSNQRALAGDLAADARMNARMAQIQGWMVLAQMIAVVSAAFVIGNALRG